MQFKCVKQKKCPPGLNPNVPFRIDVDPSISNGFVAYKTWGLPLNVSTQIVQRNLARKRLHIWANNTNIGNVLTFTELPGTPPFLFWNFYSDYNPTFVDRVVLDVKDHRILATYGVTCSAVVGPGIIGVLEVF